eukprot:1145259_1
MSSWLKQHKLSDNVLVSLHQNGVDSLDDLKLLESEQDIKDFVSSLGIKAFMTRKKLINAIKEFQNQTETKSKDNDNDGKETPKGLKRKAIRWEALESKMEKKDKIKIQSNKSEKIKIQKTEQEHKQRLSEKRYRYLFGDADGYFSEWGSEIKAAYKDDGVAWAGIGSLAVVIGTIIPIIPVWYAIDKHNQSKEDQNINHKKHYNAQSKAFNAKLRQIKRSEEYILSKQKELKQQEDKLNSHCFELERICGIRNESRVVMVIGPTGFGKSL